MDQRPLYMRVHTELVERLMAGEWAPGDTIPSEIALAEQMGVSQGTVRKAVQQLCADGALRRVQGRGTFVSEQTPERAHFRFFRLMDGDGELAVPQLYRQIGAVRPICATIAAALLVEDDADAHVIDRVRTIGGERAILETITVPESVMPGLSAHAPLPNALYPHYQSAYGVTVLRTDDRLSAVGADQGQARAFSVPVGTPLLCAERVAFDLKDRRVEHRMSFFLTRGHHFHVSLR